MEKTGSIRVWAVLGDVVISSPLQKLVRYLGQFSHKQLMTCGNGVANPTTSQLLK
jgi:hypothetical protein